MSEIPSSPNTIVTAGQGLQPVGKAHIAYPNSEYITPPVNKEATRVVDQATRTSIDIQLLEKWTQEQYIIQKGLEDLRLQSFFKKQQIVKGALVDIEV